MSTSLGVIAAGHEKTVWAGEEILRAGGNAYDAVLAAVAASFVTEPVLASPAGGGFLMAAPIDQKPLIYDFFADMPQRMKPPEDLNFYPVDVIFGTITQEFHIGLGAIAVPGQISGMFEIHKDLCTMEMSDILAPAVQLAKEGVRVNNYQAYLFDIVKAILSDREECRTIYQSTQEKGKLVQEGELLKQPQLGDFLENLSREGPDLFYRGEMASLIDRELKDGGVLTAEDLATYKTLRRKPLELNYRGVSIKINPPPASGALLIGFGLKLLESIDLGSLVNGLASSAEYRALLADVLDKTCRARAEVEAGNDSDTSLLDEVFLKKYRRDILGQPAAQRGTTHISVIDKDKNLASMTVSNGEGSGYVIPGTGVIMNNILGEKDINPGGFHIWPPGTRLSSMMAPATVLWPDGQCLAIGSGGSNRIRTAMLQVLVNLIDFKMPAEDAVNALRIHLEDNFLNVEGGFEDNLDDILKTYPDHHVWKQGKNMFFGGVHIAGYGTKGFSGTGDPRRSGVCKIL